MRSSPARPCSADGGSASLEIAILAPALLLLVFATVQAGLYAFALSLAQGAAQEGLSAGRARGASAAEGRERALEFVEEHAGDSLLAASANVSASEEVLRVEVRGRSLSVVPGLPGVPVRAHAEGPRERFTQP